MYAFCRFCHTRSDSGARHDCLTTPRVRAWIIAGWSVIALLSVTMVLWLAELRELIKGRRLAGQMLGGYSSVDVDRLRAVVRSGDSLARVVGVLAIAALLVYIGWYVAARRLVRRAGQERTFLTRHWSYVAWRLTVLASVVLAVVLGTRQTSVSGATQVLEAVRDFEQRAMIYGGVRLVSFSVLISVLVVTMRRVRGLIAEAGAPLSAPSPSTPTIEPIG